MIKSHDKISDAAKFVKSRVAVQDALEVKAQSLMERAALSLLNIAEKYKQPCINGTLLQNKQAAREIQAIMSQLRADIYKYEKASASLVAKELDSSVKVPTERYLAAKQAGKTFKQRTYIYTERFKKDIVNLARVGQVQGLNKSALKSMVKSSYQDPYSSSLMNRAIKSGKAKIHIPIYGKGISKSGYMQVLKNIRDTSSLMWSYADNWYASRNGALGFYVYRGSSYPCDTCQSHVGWLHNMDDDMPPYHSHCVCFVKFIYEIKE